MGLWPNLVPMPLSHHSPFNCFRQPSSSCYLLCFRIVTNPYAAGYNNFYERAEQKADTIYLDAGEDFLLVAEMKEGGGGDYLQVS